MVTRRSAAAIWRAASGYRSSTVSPVVAATQAVIPASSMLSVSAGSARRSDSIGVGSASPLVSMRMRENGAPAPASRRATRSLRVRARSPRTAQQRQPPRKLDHRIVGRLDEEVVDADRAQLVDDDRGVAKPLRPEKPVEERRLAASEEPGEDEDAKTPARAFGPAPRRGFADFRSVSASRRRGAHPEPRRREIRIEGEPQLAEQLEDRGDGLAVERPARRRTVPPVSPLDVQGTGSRRHHRSVAGRLRPCLDLPLGERCVEEQCEIG